MEVYLTDAQWRVLLAIVTIQAQDGPGDDGLLEDGLLTRKQWDEDYTQENLNEIKDAIKAAVATL